MRYLPERDSETLRKVIEAPSGQITKVVSHSDYVSLHRALGKVPDQWNLHDLQDYERATEKKTLEARKKKTEAEGDCLKSSLPIIDSSNFKAHILFRGDPGSWIWSWDKTHFRNFKRGVCEKD
jgi:hypothetical protein